MTLTDHEIAELKSQLNLADAADAHNVSVLKHLSREEREEFALRAGVCVLYFGEEVAEVQHTEEQAALRAMPPGFLDHQLNGLNIGSGDRAISPFLLPVDIMRLPPAVSVPGAHHAFLPSALLSLADDLPFRDNSIDYIVALHMLEHVSNPAEVISSWLRIIKPGGGIGIVVPDWRYTWDARGDNDVLGHKWNSTPEVVKSMYDKYWSHESTLETLATYSYRISFDFVLRKPGTFVPFAPPNERSMSTGRDNSERDL